MKVSRIVEEGTLPPMLIASATVWTPAGKREAAGRSWVVQADAVLRSLYPNIPEIIEGPWGSLSRSDVLGATEAGSAVADALECMVIELGTDIDSAFERCSFSISSEALSERLRSGKIELGEDLRPASFSFESMSCMVEIFPPAEFFKANKLRPEACAQKIEMLLAAMDERMRAWIPAAVSLENPAKLLNEEAQACLALAVLEQVSTATAPARKSTPARGL